MLNNQTDSFGLWFDTYDFEALITVRLPPDLPIHEVHKHYISDVIRPLAKYNRTKIGAYTVISPASEFKQGHLHSLIASNKNNLLYNLKDSLTYIRTLKNRLNTHHLAIDIQPIDYDGGVAQYVANHLAPNAEFVCYNQWILSRRKIITDSTELF